MTNLTRTRTLSAFAFALAWAPLGISPAAAAPCPEVEVVFARATTEPPGTGQVGQRFADEIRAQLPGRSVNVYAVNYPATEDFAPSASAGAFDANARIRSTAANCPGTRMVLGGYSQGALVVDLNTALPVSIAGFVPAPLPPEVSDNVAAVVVFGNPLNRTLGTSLNAVSPQYANRTLDLCNAGDPVCTPRPGDTSAPPRDQLFAPAHLGYLESGLVTQGATFAAGRLR
ncbi:cutinase family protein [Mycolicibacterium litorale]|uniref:cutinase family protein n=1 Tax=Mycolicibacterium litorale TaxID=758802 RepID=UPI003CEE8D36